MFGQWTTRALAATCALSLGTVLLAAPAHADHAAEISADGSRCILGAQASGRMGLGFKLVTFKATIEVDTVTGDLTYTCQFDVPAFHASENTIYMQHDWYLPDRPIKVIGLRCLPPGAADLSVESYDSRMVITPSGNGILTCRFAAYVPPVA